MIVLIHVACSLNFKDLYPILITTLVSLVCFSPRHHGLAKPYYYNIFFLSFPIIFFPVVFQTSLAAQLQLAYPIETTHVITTSLKSSMTIFTMHVIRYSVKSCQIACKTVNILLPTKKRTTKKVEQQPARYIRLGLYYCVTFRSSHISTVLRRQFISE